MGTIASNDQTSSNVAWSITPHNPGIWTEDREIRKYCKRVFECRKFAQLGGTWRGEFIRPKAQA